MNEAETRAELIDPALKAAGWGGVDGSKILREYHITPSRIEGHGHRAKPIIADYILVYRNHKLAVIEANFSDAAHTEGLAQAKNYATKLSIRFARYWPTIPMPAPNTTRCFCRECAHRNRDVLLAA